jgi:transposase
LELVKDGFGCRGFGGDIGRTSRETVKPPTSWTILIVARDVSENPV